MKRIAAIVLVISSFALMSFTWRTDFDKAKVDAATNHKMILLKFSGSDWCIPCISMEKKVFSDAAFLRFADSNLIMVNADFPRQKKHQPAKDIATMNDKLAAKYNKDGHFPLTLLLNPDGAVIKRWDGYSGAMPEDFILQIKQSKQ